ncbi:PilN domain-containing protein [Janthinobacterium psychrotolerans]|uniref:Type IV pilus assembly protein PilN n=1 Tax=Janthinobacterium psychrotolerans TaxID=1747903 RepID=A0A1A7BUE1_9BURK|nr:PilN domain-containing protein [Janthinobacterium psychrotolerans]OBV37127.1 type IV pilus assembly protein PilN [Janthinobacterium psychrotolerans]
MSANAPVSINLLPHRAAARRQRELGVLRQLAGGVLLGAALALAAGLALVLAIGDQARQQATWQVALREREGALAAARLAQRETAALAARQHAVHLLQARRNDAVIVLDALARAVPDGVSLNSLRQDGARLMLAGRAPSQQAVSALLLALAQALPGSTPQLQEVRSPATPAAKSGVELAVHWTLPADGLPGD